MRNKLYKILAAGFALALAFTLSCSSGGDDPSDGGGGGGGNGEGEIEKLVIKNITGSSFTVVITETKYSCRETGELEEKIDVLESETNYTINGATLSFGGAEFNGNSTSLIGAWNSSSLQYVEFEGELSCGSGCSGSGNSGYSNVSKAVFTQNSLALTKCVGEAGEEWDIKGRDEGGNRIVIGKIKVIDCGTAEYIAETEKVKVTETSATYKDKTCPFEENYSKSQMQKACTDAYNKAKAEGGYVEDYYDEILYKDTNKCFKDNNFPEWFH